MGFRFANVDGRAALVDADGRWYDLERLTAGASPADPMAALADPEALTAADAGLTAAEADGLLTDARLGPPVPRPGKVFGIGINYRSHAEETGRDVPTVPVVFAKFPSCLTGPDAAVELRSPTADWEVELVVAIGPGGRDITAERAWDHVLGLTVGQDISDRALQFAATPAHFDLAKSRDGYGPIGPVLVSPDRVPDPGDLALSCSVNGEVRQDDRTANLVFGVPALVEYLSAILTLDTGDLIFTGTPSGVGASTGTFLQPGDVIVSSVEGIGTITTRCR